ncbi:hypothetical protein [Pseudomonas poae]|nr:hypothetical protein [Pseudomonas poae]
MVIPSANATPRHPAYMAPSAEALPLAVTAPGHAGTDSTRDAALPDSPETRAVADAQVAQSYAKALATRSYQTSAVQPNVPVSPASTLGRWRTQLDNAFNSSGFLTWSKEQGLDTRDLRLDPARGELLGYVGGKIRLFSLRDDSGWSDVSRALLSIAKAIAPLPQQAFNYPWREGEVPLYTVGRFYNEPIDLTPAQAVLYRRKLAQKTRFEFAPVAHASERSVEASARQQVLLGDEANRHALIAALKSQVDDADGKIDLEHLKIPIDPRSRRFASEHLREMSVAQILRQDGNKVPTTGAQARGVARSLAFDLAHRAPRADAGGARSVVGVLGPTSLRKMGAVVGEWERRHETGAGGLLQGLISMLPDAARKAISGSPSSAMDLLIRSPEALSLGKDIQKKLKIVDTPTSAMECVMAALVQALDPGIGKSPFNLAGYNLYQKDNVGASPAQIVRRFTTHLERKVGVEAAPLAAQLLLSAGAPEFLVKDIPPNLVYGSHTWANYSIEVSRIEQQVCGAPANMTFSQVMAFGDTPLISLESEDQLSVALHDPIIAWGLANGVIESRTEHAYGYEDVKRSQEALNKQQKELAWARKALLTPATTRESLALAELKRVFPNIDPTKKVLQAPWVKHDPVSLLDVYMTGPIEPKKWMSLNGSELPWAAIESRLSELTADINTVFSEKFQEHKKTHQSAWAIQFKYQLSLLPMADQERIKKSNVSFIEVSRPFLGTELEPGFSLYPGRRPRTPTARELEALKGKHGLLMKVEEGGGQVGYYSYFPGLGKIVKEEGFPGDHVNTNDGDYFGGSTQGRVPGTYNVYKQYGNTSLDRDVPERTGKTAGTYFSARNGDLAATAASFFIRDYEALKVKAAGVTELENGKAYDQKLKDFFLSLIPFYDGIQDAIKGNVSGAVLNLGFDMLGFFLPGLNAARKSLKAGQSVVNIIKASVFAGVGASVGYTDAANIVKNLNRGAGAGYKDLKYLIEHGDEVLSRLKGHYRTYEVTRVYKEGDIVKGFYRAEGGERLTPVVAVFKKGAWYAYNVLTSTPFGPQLAQFGIVSALGSAKTNA